MAVRAVDVEAKQDFAPARPLGVRFAAYVNKPAALDVLGDDHPLPAQLGDHGGTTMNGWPLYSRANAR